MSLYDRAAIIPGRSLTCSKAPDRLIKAWAAGGKGAIVWDTTGKEYIDMLCALGAISLGYGRPASTARGVYSLPHALEVEAAEAVLTHVAPWASSIKFTKTGSEATHAAYRVAKKATGRTRVLIGDWAYHGWHEWCQPAPLTYSQGQEFGPDDSIAAVFYEPPRFVPVDRPYLEWLRAYCDRNGSLLVTDEMIYGGRHALGGATQLYNVIPDMATFGKAFGAGEAVAFVVGREAMAEHGGVASGTYSGCATGLQAVVDTIHAYLTEPVIDTLWARGQQLADGLEQMLAPYPGLAVREGQPVHQRVRFLENHLEQGKRLTDAMAERGVLWHPDVCNVSYAHTPAQIDRVIGAFAESLKELA